MSVTISIAITLAIAIVGWILWWVCTKSAAKTALAKLGEVMLWAGMFAFCISVGAQILKI